MLEIKNRSFMVYEFFVNRILKGILNQLKWGACSFTDPIFYLFLSLGFVGLYVPSPDLKLSLALLFAKAFIEELFSDFFFKRGLIAFSGMDIELALSVLLMFLLHLFFQVCIWLVSL